MDHELAELSREVGATLAARGWLLATAESCTGGWIAEVVTATGGSSAWFDRGFVTYSNRAKTEMLGVPEALLERHGAVSAEVAAAMAAGARERAAVACAVAVTGVAGPTGGSATKPVGTVWFGWATPAGVMTECRRFDGDRAAVRRQTVAYALQGLLDRL